MSWTECSVIGVPLDNAKRSTQLWSYNTATPSFPVQDLSPDAWHTIDLSNGPQWNYNGDTTGRQPNLPADIKSVFLSGILIITNATPGIADMWVNFKAPNSALSYDNYQAQTCIQGVGGQRTNAAVWVPVVDRKFQLYWHYEAMDNAWYGFNFSVQAYTR